MPSLAEFQRDMAAALIAQGEVPAGLRVHRNTTVKGLVDAVLANYPTVAVLMGEEWLAELARRYALQHPPARAALADYGELFPQFLHATQLAADWPYVPAVAKLDRAWTEALLAADAPALAPQHLASLAPDALIALKLRLHPATRFGVYAHSAVTVWLSNRPPAVPPAQLVLDGADEAALFVRNANGVQLLPLDAAGHGFVQAVIDGYDIGTAAARALEALPTADVAAIWSTLLTEGAFAANNLHGD